MSGTSTEIGMGIIGLGFMGRRYAQFVSQLEGMRVAGVFDLDGELAERTVAEFGGQVFGSVDALTSAATVDAVMVCTPEHLHVDAAVSALRAGKPTMVEKPIAHSLDAARTIAEAASASGAPLLAAHILRFEPRWMAARQRLDAGSIGDVVSITTRRIGNVLDQDVLKGRTSIPLYYGVHDLDVMSWFANSRAVSLTATCRGGALRAKGYDIDDVYTAVLTYENGVLGTAELGWHVPAEALAARSSGVVIVGTKGFIRIEQAETGFECWSDGHLDRALDLVFWSDVYGLPSGALGLELRHFAECARGRCDPIITPAEAIEALRLSLAMEQAASAGATVDLRTFDAA
jgi:myo-inositol 2-dehydrogenase/D-chiro-inositol 1-dehydrogenase